MPSQGANTNPRAASADQLGLEPSDIAARIIEDRAGSTHRKARGDSRLTWLKAGELVLLIRWLTSGISYSRILQRLQRRGIKTSLAALGTFWTERVRPHLGRLPARSDARIEISIPKKGQIHLLIHGRGSSPVVVEQIGGQE